MAEREQVKKSAPARREETIEGVGEAHRAARVHLTGRAEAVRARGQPSRWLDAREVLVVEKTDLGAMVQWKASTDLLRERFGTMLENLTRDAPDPAAQRIVEEMEVHHQRDYPYIPPTFYLFVGEPTLHLR